LRDLPKVGGAVVARHRVALQVRPAAVERHVVKAADAADVTADATDTSDATADALLLQDLIVVREQLVHSSAAFVLVVVGASLSGHELVLVLIVEEMRGNVRHFVGVGHFAGGESALQKGHRRSPFGVVIILDIAVVIAQVLGSRFGVQLGSRSDLGRFLGGLFRRANRGVNL